MINWSLIVTPKLRLVNLTQEAPLLLANYFKPFSAGTDFVQITSKVDPRTERFFFIMDSVVSVKQHTNLKYVKSAG